MDFNSSVVPVAGKTISFKIDFSNACKVIKFVGFNLSHEVLTKLPKE